MTRNRIPALLCAALLWAAHGLPAQQTPLNGVAARVEDRVITLGEVLREMQPAEERIRSEARSRLEFQRRRKELAEQVLNRLIDRTLIIREFEKSEMIIPPDILEQRYDDHITEEFEGDRAEFLEYLRAIGKSDREFRQEMKERLIVGAMRNERMGSPTAVSPVRVREYYEANRAQFYQEEQVRLRMIVLEQNDDETAEEIAVLAQSILDEFETGRTFDSLARQYSEGDKANSGGLWGWIDRDMLKSDLADVAFDLEPGTASEPVTLGRFTYILLAENRKSAGVRDLEDVRGKVEERIATEMAREAMDRWIQRLRARAFIRTYLNDVTLVQNDGQASETPIEMNLNDEENTAYDAQPL